MQLQAQQPAVGVALPLGDVPVHDPVMIKAGNAWYLFATGRGIAVWSSPDMKTWKRERPVFDSAPAWAVKAVPEFKNNHIWAPDISYHNGMYHLYYSISAFGKNTSCIGLAVNKTLDTTSPDYGWKDLGKIVQSIPGRDNWNAIDPNLVLDDNGIPWLAFGSFWDGIKLVKLTADGTSVAEPQEWRALASRRRGSVLSSDTSADGSIEAPFIIKRNNYYYLFVSFDMCCKGPQSTYKMMVGRSTTLTGNYTDKNGVSMAKGGGSLLLAGDAGWYGVGHNAVASDNKKDILVFHGYDAKDKGRSKLRIEILEWDAQGWPFVKPATAQ